MVNPFPDLVIDIPELYYRQPEVFDQGQQIAGQPHGPMIVVILTE